MIAKGRGRRSWLPEGTVAEVVRTTLHETPRRRLDALDHADVWPSGSGSARTPWLGSGGITSSSRGRPTTFKISNDPRFEEKLVDVVGLYLDPPERAVVFSFDEKTQCPGVGPHPAEPADDAGPGRDHDP